MSDFNALVFLIIAMAGVIFSLFYTAHRQEREIKALKAAAEKRTNAGPGAMADFKMKYSKLEIFQFQHIFSESDLRHCDLQGSGRDDQHMLKHIAFSAMLTAMANYVPLPDQIFEIELIKRTDLMHGGDHQYRANITLKYLPTKK